MGALINRHLMPKNGNFSYKKGRTEIRSHNDNRRAIRLAYINTIFYWVLRIGVAAACIYRVFSE